MPIIKKIKLILKYIFYPQQTLQAKRVANYKSHGGNNLRYQYDLNANSIVFDLGGYQGEWTNEIFVRFQPYIYIFEPVAEYAQALKNKYQWNQKIKVFDFGLSKFSKDEIIFENNNSSSAFIKDGKPQNIHLEASDSFLNRNNIQRIDLMKINIEGGEYDLLENLISTEDIKKINNIQVQFHDFVPNAKERMSNIQENLKKTHHPTYQFEFVWENWEINKN
jgi:FkbM family methyltransferase